jgi:putative oxidoreductase
MQDLSALIGRILLAVLFILSGYSKIGAFDPTVAYIASVGLPLPAAVAALTIVVEIGGGLALIAGLKTGWAAIVLAVFTLLAALLFHNFWAAPATQQTMQYVQFLKNLAITGGLLVLAAFGPGRWSLDGRR